MKSFSDTVKPARSDDAGFKFHLSDHEIDQIVIAYFQSLERGAQDAGGYRHGVLDLCLQERPMS